MAGESTESFLPHTVFTMLTQEVSIKVSMDNLVSRFSTRNNKEFRKELRMQSGKDIFESDINPVF